MRAYVPFYLAIYLSLYQSIYQSLYLSSHQSIYIYTVHRYIRKYPSYVFDRFSYLHGDTLM